jgi:hypothetical protein
MSEGFRLDRSGEASNFSSERKVGWLLKMGKVYSLVPPSPWIFGIIDLGGI